MVAPRGEGLRLSSAELAVNSVHEQQPAGEVRSVDGGILDIGTGRFVTLNGHPFVLALIGEP